MTLAFAISLIVAIAAGIGVVVLLVIRGRLWDDVRAAADQLADQGRTIQHLENRISALRSELSEQFQTIAELNARLRAVTEGPGRGLWTLERLRQRRAAGLAPDGAMADLPEVAGEADIDLAAAIGAELEIIREEVGTPADLTPPTTDAVFDATEALAVLRTVQELAALLARRSESLVVSIDPGVDSVGVRVRAEGWEDPTLPGRTALEWGFTSLGATLEVEQDDTGLLATVSLPRR